MLKPKFLKHLQNCLISAEYNDNNNSAEIVLRENLELVMTYIIIGQEMIVLKPYTSDEVGVNDNTKTFYSEDKETIKYFTKLFKEAWQNEKNSGTIISSNFKLEGILPIDKDILNDINWIKSLISDIPDNSLQKEYVRNRLKGLVRDIESAKKGVLRLKNESVSSYFYFYMGRLEKKGSYDTISCLKFWREIVESNRFLRKNKSALDRGAKISRYYLIDLNKLDDKEYIKDNSKILNGNINLSNSYEHYEFTVLPVEDYKSKIEEYMNFALWQNNDNAVLFIPDPYSYGTNLFFFGKNDLIENTLEDIEELSEANESLKYISDLSRDFYSKSFDSFNNNEECSHKKLVDFLEACEIDDVNK